MGITASLALSFLATAQSKTAGPMNDVTGRDAPWFQKGAKSSIPENERILRVVVRDEKGDALGRAAVTLKQVNSGKAVVGLTSEVGQYIFYKLERNQDYELTAEWEGRKSEMRKLSRFLPDQRVSLSLVVPPKGAPAKKAEDPEEK
jgi:hypothetical protein